MPIRFRCAYCNQLLGIARRKVGTVVRCPTCAGQVVVPDRDAEGLGDEASEQPLFERNDFDDLLSLPGNGDSPRALASQPQASPRVVEPAGSWGTHAEPEFDIERLFYASSACVYAADKQVSPEVIALKESDAYPAMPEDGYGWEKLFSERMCRHFREDFGVVTRAARYHNVYGPHGTWTGGREKAPAAICRKVIDAKLAGKHQIEIWGDGKQTRSFMYIDDCLKGTQAILNSKIVEPINLGSNELVTINGLVDMVEQIGGVKLQRTYNLKAPKGVNGRNSDNALIKQYLGWEPSVRLRDGLEKTYRWIYDQMVPANPRDPRREFVAK